MDDNETWHLLEASENGTHTYLKVGRQLNTCDSQDVAIGVSLINFKKDDFDGTSVGIWAGVTLAAQASRQFVLSNGTSTRICANKGSEHKFIKSCNHVIFAPFSIIQD